MKIKFNTFEKVKAFCDIASKLENDILIKSGRYVIDGKKVLWDYTVLTYLKN